MNIDFDLIAFPRHLKEMAGIITLLILARFVFKLIVEEKQEEAFHAGLVALALTGQIKTIEDVIPLFASYREVLPDNLSAKEIVRLRRWLVSFLSRAAGGSIKVTAGDPISCIPIVRDLIQQISIKDQGKIG